MSLKWNEITRDHVLQAIWKHDNSGTEGYARSTFLRHEGRLYPAKHIRALAYEVAFGRPVERSRFSGGKETVVFGIMELHRSAVKMSQRRLAKKA